MVLAASAVANPIDPHWAGDVLDLVLAHVFEDEGQPVADLVLDVLRDEHPAGLGQRL